MDVPVQRRCSAHLPSCGERTLRTEERCRCCGAVLPPESQCPEPPTQSQPGTDADGRFDYNDLYRQYQQTVEEPTRRNVQAAFGKEELIDGIPYSDWNDYIGKAAPVYLNDYSRMQLQHTKISMCFSRWCSARSISSTARRGSRPLVFWPQSWWWPCPPAEHDAGHRQSAHCGHQQHCHRRAFPHYDSVQLCAGDAAHLYAKWLYRKSAAERIRRIRAEFPDAAQRVRSVCAGRREHRRCGRCLVLLMVLGAALPC